MFKSLTAGILALLASVFGLFHPNPPAKPVATTQPTIVQQQPVPKAPPIELTVVNDYFAAPTTLIAGTRFKTADGRVFLANQRFTVPGKHGAANGTITISATAVAPGQNPIGRLSLPGLAASPAQYAHIYATAAAPAAAQTASAALVGSDAVTQQQPTATPSNSNNTTQQLQDLSSPQHNPTAQTDPNTAIGNPKSQSALQQTSAAQQYVTKQDLSAIFGGLGRVVALLPGALATGNFVTHDFLTKQIERTSDNVSDSLDNHLPLGGGTLTGNLTVDGVTGLAAADIPNLSSSYLSLGGGAVTGTSSITALGIGTTSPSETFALNGAAYLADIAAPASTANRLYANSGSLYWAGNVVGGATTGTWTSDGTNVWRAGGFVGIGTTSPATTLSVAGNTYLTGGLGVGALNTTAGTLNLAGTTGTSTIAAGQGFTIGSSQFVLQQGSGNVGIGTSNPSSALTVNKTGSADLWLQSNTLGDGAIDGSIALHGSDGTGFFMELDRRSCCGKGLVFWKESPAASYTDALELGLDGQLTLNRFGGTDYPSTVSFAIATTSTNVELISLNPIGSSMLASTTIGLAIRGGDFQTANLQEWQTRAGAALTVVTAQGSIGIGTTTPNNKLDIYSTTKAALGFNSNSGLSDWTIGQDASDGGKFKISSSTALGTNDRFVIDGSGNVGIGTTSPQYLLDIQKSSGGNVLNLQANALYADFQGISYRDSAINHVILDGYGYRGTQAAPLAINQGDTVMAVDAEAYDGVPGTAENGDGTNEIGKMIIRADENQTTYTHGGAFWFSTTGGDLLNKAQVANGFATSSLQLFPDFRFYIGSNGNIGVGTGAINCNLNTTCFINEDVAHHFPTQVYFGSTNGGTAYYGGAASTAYSTTVVIVPGTNQSTIPLLTVGGSAASTTFSSTGNVGIGTTTPYSRLEVWGPDTASTSAFAVVNSASTTAFAVYDTGNAVLAGGLTQNSDQRLKTNIAPLDASSSLAEIEALNPVSFDWINGIFGGGNQLGFIAQEVQHQFPQLVSTTSPTALTPGGTLGLNYTGLIAPIIGAIKALASKIASLEHAVAGFAESFRSKTITATNELCVGSTCVTPAQFQAMVAAAGQRSAASGPTASSAPLPAASPTTDPTSTTTPAVTTTAASSTPGASADTAATTTNPDTSAAEASATDTTTEVTTDTAPPSSTASTAPSPTDTTAPSEPTSPSD